MSGGSTALKLTEWRVWLSERPWVRIGLSAFIWLAVVFGLQRGGSAVLGVALVTTAVAVTVLFVAVSFTDYLARSETETIRRQRARNMAIGLALGGLVLLFYVATIVRLGGNALSRPM